MPQVGGQIGHYGLGKWWFEAFTEDQRDFIERKFKPLMGGSLTTGPTDYHTNRSAIGFLTDLASWFKSGPHLPLALAMLEHSEKLLTPGSDVLDAHFLYGALAEYYEKSPDPEVQVKAIKAATNQIRVCQQALAAFQRKQYSGAPSHAGFGILLSTYIAHEQFDNAEQLCRIALKTGWWDQAHFDRNMAEIEQERAGVAEDAVDD